MNLTYFQNAVDNKYLQMPNEQYRDIQQAFYDEQWDNTTARIEILEQDYIGAKTFHKIDAWINKAIGSTTTFAKTGEDFRQLVFRKIDKQFVRGLLYKFENSYWITDFTNPSQGLAADINVRRCNNWMRIIDPENGAIYSEPCVIDYDATSPSVQTSTHIITPNNRLGVWVQANENTLRLFKLNTRYIFGGRAFKLNAYQNALLKDLDVPLPTFLALDLYLDEAHAKDDIENQVAYNGDYDYILNFEPQNVEVKQGDVGTLTPVLTLNSVSVNRQLNYISSDKNIVEVDEEGNYTVLGKSGNKAIVKVWLEGNLNVNASIEFNIVDQPQDIIDIDVVPYFEKIRQYETIRFVVTVTQNGAIVNTPVEIQLQQNETMLSVLSIGQNEYELNCSNFDNQIHNITINVPELGTSKTYGIKLVSMLG